MKRRLVIAAGATIVCAAGVGWYLREYRRVCGEGESRVNHFMARRHLGPPHYFTETFRRNLDTIKAEGKMEEFKIVRSFTQPTFNPVVVVAEVRRNGVVGEETFYYSPFNGGGFEDIVRRHKP